MPEFSTLLPDSDRVKTDKLHLQTCSILTTRSHTHRHSTRSKCGASNEVCPQPGVEPGSGRAVTGSFTSESRRRGRSASSECSPAKSRANSPRSPPARPGTGTNHPGSGCHRRTLSLATENSEGAQPGAPVLGHRPCTKRLGGRLPVRAHTQVSGSVPTRCPQEARISISLSHRCFELVLSPSLKLIKIFSGED